MVKIKVPKYLEDVKIPFFLLISIPYFPLVVIEFYDLLSRK